MVVGTVTPDMMYPSTACLVQHKLGIHSTWGFDVSAVLGLSICPQRRRRVHHLRPLHGLNAMDKSNTKLMANRRSVSVQRILRSEIEGFIPVGADCTPGPEQPAVKIAFFDGRPQSMRFVSS